MQLCQIKFYEYLVYLKEVYLLEWPEYMCIFYENLNIDIISNKWINKIKFIWAHIDIISFQIGTVFNLYWPLETKWLNRYQNKSTGR